MVKNRGQVQKAVCDQCGHGWVLRSAKLPVRCVAEGCRSTRWNKGARKPAAKAVKSAPAKATRKPVKRAR